MRVCLSNNSIPKTLLEKGYGGKEHAHDSHLYEGHVEMFLSSSSVWQNFARTFNLYRW
jgi:hypothetical protein